MPEYRAPGVYVEEIDTGAMPLEGVGTRTAGFIGTTERGPIDPSDAGVITSPEEFNRTFGGSRRWRFDEDQSSHVAAAVHGFFTNGGTSCYVARITGANAETASVALADGGGTDVVTVEAVGPGAWGNNVVVILDNASIDPDGATEMFKLTARYWTSPPADAELGADQPARRPVIEEVYDNLSPEEGEVNFYESAINGSSDLITVTQEAVGRPATRDGDAAIVEQLANGADDAPARDNYVGATTMTDGETTRTGLEAFEAIDDIAILCAPNENSVDAPGDLTQLIVNHCEAQGDRFAVLQAARDFDPESGVPDGAISQRGYSAFYYPWVEVTDPQTNLPELLPPGGHIAGIYARSDGTRGVHKAPANEAVRGIKGLQRDVTQREQANLNPRGINCIRRFRGRGPLVWGARTTSPNPLWKYVNVRRLFLFLEESIQEGTQWAVFEPNDEALWARVRQSVGNFLTDVWRDGALMGATPEEAFYVKADRSTMTQNDIDNGRLVVEVGVAPVKPAEFVIFRITQTTVGAEGA